MMIQPTESITSQQRRDAIRDVIEGALDMSDWRLVVVRDVIVRFIDLDRKDARNERDRARRRLKAVAR